MAPASHHLFSALLAATLVAAAADAGQGSAAAARVRMPHVFSTTGASAAIAMPAAAEAVSSYGGRAGPTFKVTDFGAVGDNATLNTKARHE